MMVQHPFTGWQFYFELDAHGSSSFFQCLAGAEDLKLSDYYDDAVYMLATPLLTSNVIYIKCFITAIFTGSVYIVTGTVFSTSCLGIPSLPNTPTQSLFFFAYAAKLY
jgi:hypothetical protein